MEPAKLIAETFENGCHNEFTTFGFRFSQWEEKARQVLSANSYGYVKGSAGDGYTDNQECQDFKKWQFVPRRLVPVSQCDVCRSTRSSDRTCPPLSLSRQLV